MTLAAWMIAQDTRRIERDAFHLVAIREARRASDDTFGRRVSRLLSTLGRRPSVADLDRCAA